MVNWIVRFALTQRVVVLVVALALLAWGGYSFTQLPVEAYPDVMDTQVQIIAQWPGHAAEEVEQQITVPLETALFTVPHVSSLRSRSLFGLSALYLNFDDGIDDYFAREQVNENMVNATLPNGVQPNMSPMASATGEMYRYTLTGDTPMNLKTIEDWTLEREFKSVPGIADVNSFGGTVKQYQIVVDPDKLRAHNVSIQTVANALGNGNANAGGSYVEFGSEEYVVRGLGLFKSTRDIENTVVAETNGTPLRVKDLGKVQIGYEPRLGKVGWIDGQSTEDHDDAVEGIVLLRRGEAPDPVLNRIHKKVEDLNNGILPAGVKLHKLYDRTDLVHTTTHTVEKNLIEGVCLVVAVLVLFLGNLRAALIVAITIPFGLFFAFSWMNVLHVPANLLSLGAIDFGVIVNGTVIFVENAFRRLAQRLPGPGVTRTILAAASEVESEIFFTTLIIILAYLPLFTMQSVEKKMFSPMACTMGLALVGSLIMALVVAPPLCYYLLRNNVKEFRNPIEAALRRTYARALGWATSNPWSVLSAGLALVILGGTLLPRLGTEFLPHLDEGNLWIRLTMPTTISYTEAAKVMPKLRKAMATYQPVRLVVSQLGRPDDGTDATGFYNAEFFVDLKPYNEWKGFRNKDDLINKMNADLGQMPGCSLNFSQNIEDNVEEAVTGVKGELAVKLFGDNLDLLEKKANEVQNVMASVPGVVDLTVFHETGEPQVTVTADRDKLARYGLNTQDVDNVVQTAIGVNPATQVLDGERRFNVVARLEPNSRTSVDEIRNIKLTSPDGELIPLGQVADVKLHRGAAFIYREADRRFIAIKFGVRGRGLGGTIEEAQRRVKNEVAMPSGYYTVWGGEFESMQRANARLAVIVPVTLLLIFMVLYTLFNNVSRPFIVMMNVPMSLSGAVMLLYMTHFHLSVSAAVGFTALFGVAVQNGVIMVSFFDHLREYQSRPFMEAVLEGAETRMRPVLMTALLASIGLVPAALSTGIGSDVQKPIAIAIIGGMIGDVLLGTLFVLPVLYSLIAKPRDVAAPELGGAAPQVIG